MPDHDFSQRTHAPTPKRQQQAREKGQIPRSRDLNTVLITFSGAIALLFTMKSIYQTFATAMKDSFVAIATQNSDFSKVIILFKQLGFKMVGALLPMFIVLLVISVIGPIVLGGWQFNLSLLKPKFERMSPSKGLKRMFALRSIVDLIKSLLKFSVIIGCAAALVWTKFDDLLTIGMLPTTLAITQGLDILGFALIVLSASLIIFAALDVPYQLWDHNRKMRMSFQEIKDEIKETEGSPEVKSRLKKQHHHGEH